MATRRKDCVAGHERCDCKLVCCQIPPDRVEEIRSDARSGVNWAEAHSPGPACLCGMRPARTCHRHPERN